MGEQFLDVQIFAVLPFPHGCQEPHYPGLPLPAYQRTDLVCPVAADDMLEVSPPARGHVVGDIIHRVTTHYASPALPRSSGRGSISSTLPRGPSG